MIIRRIIFLFCVLFSSQALALELTVEDCVRLGLEQNDNLKAMAAEVEIDAQSARIAYAELFPTIRLEGSYTLRDQPPHFTLGADLFGPGLPPKDALVEGEKSHYAAVVKLVQPLFAGGRLTGAHKNKDLLVEARRFRLNDQARLTIYQIKKSFYQVLIRNNELAVSEEVVASHAEELRIKQELQLADKTTIAETLAAESQLLFAKTEKLQAEQAYQNAKDDLAALMGTEGPLQLIEPKLYAILAPEFEVSQGAALKERNDLKQLGAQIDAASQSVEVARSGYYPQLNFEASYLNQRETDITEADIWEAGLKLEWSLFEAGKTDAEVARAKAEHLRLKHIRKDLERSVDNEIKAAIRSVREHEILVEANKLQLMATEKEYTYQLELFHAGKQTKLDVLKSRAKLVSRNARYQTTINQLRISLAALESTLSSPIESQLIAQEAYLLNLKPVNEPGASSSVQSPPEEIQQSHSRAALPFAVQLGAFRSESAARSFMAALQEKFPIMTFETVTVNDWKKVRATQFASRKIAEKALAGFAGKGFVVHVAKQDTRTD